VSKTLADSYFNLEKLLGADRAGRALIPPKADAPPEEKNAFFAKLGRPELPDGYDFKLDPKAMDAMPLLKDAAKMFHGAGLTKEQGDALGQWYLSKQAEADKQFSERSTQELTALQAELGAGFADKVELGKRGMRALGFEPAQVAAIERAIGTAAMFRAFVKVGSGTAEAPGAGTGDGSKGASFTLTANQAQSKIAELRQDSDFQGKLLSHNPSLRAEATKYWEDLHKAAYPG